MDKNVIDEIIPVSDDTVFEATKNIAKMGYLVGLSSGAVMHAALERAKQLTTADTVVVIFADSGRAYLSKVFG